MKQKWIKGAPTKIGEQWLRIKERPCGSSVAVYNVFHITDDFILLNIFARTDYHHIETKRILAHCPIEEPEE